MREIGGYFELERLPGSGYYPELLPLNTGRGALLYLLRARKIRKVYLPRLLCGSVSGICRRHGYECELYSVGSDFLPAEELVPGEDEAVYIVNYYGQLYCEDIRALKQKYGRIILDNVQSFFAGPQKGIDTLYSCRKFFGVPDGAYLSTDAEILTDIPEDRSGGRLAHLIGRLEDGASAHYAEFKENDSAFAEHGVRQMSKVTENLLAAIDYTGIAQTRQSNFAVLDSLLHGRNLLSPHNNEGPFAYPFLCRNGAAAKKALAEIGIYIPTLWPDVLSFSGTAECDLAENILPLPCDQRYGASEMEYIAKEVLKCTV